MKRLAGRDADDETHDSSGGNWHSQCYIVVAASWGSTVLDFQSHKPLASARGLRSVESSALRGISPQDSSEELSGNPFEANIGQGAAATLGVPAPVLRAVRGWPSFDGSLHAGIWYEASNTE